MIDATKLDATKLYKIGDHIEVRKVDKDTGQDVWIPATCVAVGYAYVVAVYADNGKRQTMQPQHVRPADVS